MRTTHTYLAPLACLALALRNVAARMMADRDPDGYDRATCYGDPRTGIGEAPDAYTAIGPDGFAMFGAFGDPKLARTADEHTGAAGFLPDGELPGFGCDPHVAAQWAARQTEQDERVANLAAQWGLTERRALEAMSVDAGPDVDTAGACWSTSEGLADTTELSDDTDRYAHLADAHTSDERATERATKRTCPAMSDRELRFAKLAAWLAAATKAGKTDAIATARKGWGERYATSVKACLKAGNWDALYLTREQALELGAVSAYLPPAAYKSAMRLRSYGERLAMTKGRSVEATDGAPLAHPAHLILG